MMMNAYYANNLLFLTNIPTQAKSLLHSLEQAAGDIGLSVNANFMCFKQDGATIML